MPLSSGLHPSHISTTKEIKWTEVTWFIPSVVLHKLLGILWLENILCIKKNNLHPSKNQQM